MPMIRNHSSSRSGTSIHVLLFLVATLNVAPHPVTGYSICRGSKLFARVDCVYFGCHRKSCHLEACTEKPFQPPHTPGWKCIVNDAWNPDDKYNTSSFLPIRTPTAIIAPTRSPFPVIFRRNASFSHAHVIEVPGSDIQYIIRYVVNLPSAGVVSISGIHTLLRRAWCHDGGVTLQFYGHYRRQPITAIFPVGAILVVAREQVGSCPQLKTGVGDNAAPGPVLEALDVVTDVYMRIDAVYGTLGNVRLTGTAVSYFALFKYANLFIQRLGMDKEPSPFSTLRRRTSPPFHPPVTQALSASGLLQMPFNSAPLYGRAGGVVHSEVRLESMRAWWNHENVEIEFQLRSDVTVQASLDFWMRGTGNMTKERLMSKSWWAINLSVPIGSAHNNDTDDGEMAFSLPPLRMAFFEELSLNARAKGSSIRGIGANSSVYYRVAGSNRYFRIFGAPNNLTAQVGSRHDGVTEARFNSNATREIFDPHVDGEDSGVGDSDKDNGVAGDEDGEVEVAMFSARFDMRPRQAVAFPFAAVTSSVDLSVGIEVESNVDPNSALSPVVQPREDGGEEAEDICTSCHRLHVARTARRGNTTMTVFTCVKQNGADTGEGASGAPGAPDNGGGGDDVVDGVAGAGGEGETGMESVLWTGWHFEIPDSNSMEGVSPIATTCYGKADWEKGLICSPMKCCRPNVLYCSQC